MRLPIIISFIFLSTSLSAQLFGDNQIGVINDSDGYTLIRESQSSSSAIVDTIFKDEFLKFVENDSSDWFKVYKTWNISGYMHKSRITNIKNLNRLKQQQIISSLFERKKELSAKKNLEISTSQHLLYEEDYSVVLELLISYNCASYDNEVLQQFMEILIIDKGSADELPSWTLGYIYLCHPDEIIELVKKNNHRIIYSHLEFGFGNVSYKKEEKIENYERLKKGVDETMKHSQKN